MTGSSGAIHLGGAVSRASTAPVGGGFTSIDGERYASIQNVDQMAPFLMNVVSDSDTWLFVGSNGPFTAGRGSPDTALFPYQTVDMILRHPTTSGARTSLLINRDGVTSLWEPWLGSGAYRTSRNLYKRVDGTAVLFEEINHDLGVRFRWRLEACAAFGVVRWAELEETVGEPVAIRYLDGFHQILPPGVDQETYARLSYLATAYMRHELLPGVPLAVYTLNAAISDRPEPSESLRAAAAWSIGHPNPVILLSDRQLETFRRGEVIQPEREIRGQVGAYLVGDAVHLSPRGRHSWRTVGDTGLDHAAVVERRAMVAAPHEAGRALDLAQAENRAGIRRRVAGSDGLQHSADETVSANHFSNVLFNVMRGGSFDDGYRIPIRDLGDYLRRQSVAVHERNRGWLEGLPADTTLRSLREATQAQRDPQLTRLVAAYLPLTFSRRHGDPSRPWNRFSIRLRDDAGRPVFGYQGNWRDIFQNWEALSRSYPDYLPAFITVFLNASTADGYNPYRITRSGGDWEVEDPRDPWSHIGYWGDHQIVYLLRLLESLESHEPGRLAALLNERSFAYAVVPYRIAGLDTILADPRATIEFDGDWHATLQRAAEKEGADAKLVLDDAGEVRLVTLGEKLLVPVLVKLTNFVPGGGIWLNTQRPEWNDANNALAGWGLSIVTLCAMRRYVKFLGELAAADREVRVSAAVARLLQRVTTILQSAPPSPDEHQRYRILVELGRAGEEHRHAVYAGHLGDEARIPTASVRALVAAAGPMIDETLQLNRRPDGLWHSYNLLNVDGDRAEVSNLGLMLEGQVAILDSEMLSDDETVRLLRALRTSALYRPDQHSYLLYPDRPLTPYLELNRLASEPPVSDPRLFVRDRDGDWHFNADLSTVADLQRRLDDLAAGLEDRAAVLDLWRTTFAHDEFTGRSGTFFMFEGLGSVYWHMVAKLLLAVQACHRRTADPTARDALAEIYTDIRNGLGFRKTPEAYGAFPTDPYSHTPRHLGAQQPGMTGQAKEQILIRLGELGVEVAAGRLCFRPRLLRQEEFFEGPSTFSWLDIAGVETASDLPPGSLAFTVCQVPICYRHGDMASIELERADGSREKIAGFELDPSISFEIFARTGAYRRITVTVPRDR